MKKIVIKLFSCGLGLFVPLLSHHSPLFPAGLFLRPSRQFGQRNQSLIHNNIESNSYLLHVVNFFVLRTLYKVRSFVTLSTNFVRPEDIGKEAEIEKEEEETQ